MSMIYGVADVSEDLWLARFFSRSREVTKMEGEIACSLTETKLETISLSLVGGLLILVLDRTFSKREGPT
jgi:hypothetical protein